MSTWAYCHILCESVCYTGGLFVHMLQSVPCEVLSVFWRANLYVSFTLIAALFHSQHCREGMHDILFDFVL
jgi:succinate dehydrogenase hydrophobic anchor subunit